MPRTTNKPASSTDTELQYVASDDVIETSTEQTKNVEIRPDFFTMDESGVKQYARELTDWLRDRGAVVRGPKSLDSGVDDVAEYFYEWEMAEGQAVTVRFIANNELDALRGCINEAFVRRYEV